MTTEICVMNRRALVLAADSAVTVTRSVEGKTEERYFKGANKVFELSSFQPLGLMIFDSANLQRVPWEIIAKTFRDSLNAKKCGTIEDYSKEFFSFIENHKGLFPDEDRKSNLIDTIDQIMIRNLRNLQNHKDYIAARHDPAKMEDARAKYLDDMLGMLTGLNFANGFAQADMDAIVRDHGAKLLEEAKVNLKVFGNDSPYDPQNLLALALHAIFKAPEIFMSSTGIVVGGYGDDDYFPSYKEYLCYGFIGEKLLFTESGGHKISTRDSGHIKAFATTAMVETFTMGFGPDVYKSVKSGLQSVLQRFAADVIAGSGGISPANLDALINATVDQHTKEWTDLVKEKHARPLKHVIGSLPIDEMASLAETLIDLESLKEKVTQPSESVGGPIDVAVITKSEGFVWVKRKHFFDPKLNPKYFLRQRDKFDPTT